MLLMRLSMNAGVWPVPVAAGLMLDWGIFNPEQDSSRVHQQRDPSCLQPDYTTHNFMQWYVSEQIEEEGLA